MKNTKNKLIRYAVFADNCNGTVVIKNLEANNFFIRNIDQIIKDEKVLQGLSKEHIKHIQAIARFYQG